MNKVSVVVCTLNREKELGDFLGSLRNQTFHDYELIIVSNNKLNIRSAKVIVQKGRGLPNARNEAIPHVKGRIVAFFDDDVILEKYYLENIVKVFDNNPDVGGVCGRLKPREQNVIKSGIFGKLMRFYAGIFGISGFFVNLGGVGRVLPTGFTASNFENVTGEKDVDWLGGAMMSYRKDAMEKTGKFSEDLIGNAYYEDTDYSYRVKKNGFRLVCTQDAVLDHLVTPTSRESLPKLKYYQLRNHRTFFYRNVHGGSTKRKIRYAIARGSLFFPILAYSTYVRNAELLRSYFRAIIDG